MAMQLPLSTIDDPNTRQALDTVQKTYNGNVLNKGDFKLFTISESGVVTGKELYHGLGFIPTDVLTTKQEGGTVIWDYDRFTTEKAYYTTSGAIELRVLLGRIN